MLFLFVVAAAMFASCSEEYKKTKSGLVYKLYSDKKGSVAKKGQIIKLHFRQKLKDSVLQETYGGVPGYAMVDSVGPVYNAAELFTSLRKGDSLVVVLSGDSINKKFGLPPFMKKDDNLTLTFKVLDVFENAELATKDRSTEYAKQSDVQTKVFDNYMASRKDKCQKTPSGAYVEITAPGDGPQVETGKLVSILYDGKFLPSGKSFETNMTGGAPPIDVVVGTGSVITGWEEGLLLFKKGAKGIIYVPGNLAYGEQGGPPGSQPFQPMMFDIQIMDVKDAPKQQAQPPMMQMPDTTHGHK